MKNPKSNNNKPVVLDEDRLIELMKKADTKWFLEHHSHYDYNGHLAHTAKYIVANYNRRRVCNRQL